MITAHALARRGSLASALRAEISGLVAGARNALKRRRTYLRTLAELRQLPSLTLRDLDFDRGDLGAIARREVYDR